MYPLLMGYLTLYIFKAFYKYKDLLGLAVGTK